MKRIISIIAFVALFICAKAQENYEQIMKQNIQLLDSAKDANTLSRSASVFAVIYAGKKDWHPLYYECLAYLRLTKILSDQDKKTAALQQALALLNTLPPEQDEVQVLKALYAMEYLEIDHSEWQTYLPMLEQALQKAEELNPDNPRAYYLEGVLKYGMPESMGGGHDAGLKLMELSKKKFDAYRSADALAPDWGKNEMLDYLRKKN